jgi:hypothetical protein
MNKKFLIIVILGLSLGTIYQWTVIRTLKVEERQRSTKHRVDTVYISKPFELSKSLKETESPSKVSIYNRTKLDRADGGDLGVGDSIIQVSLKSNKLDLSFYNPVDSIVKTATYDIDLTRYRYLYNQGSLTKQKISAINTVKFIPYLSARYRPFNQSYEMSGGLSITSRHFTYSVGLVGQYQKDLSSKLQKDLELSITYNF